jgi:hypothetical protein
MAIQLVSLFLFIGGFLLLLADWDEWVAPGQQSRLLTALLFSTRRASFGAQNKNASH